MRYTSDPALSGFLPLEDGGARMLVRHGYETHARALGLYGIPAHTGEVVRGGRTAHPVIELPGGEKVVVRGYRRGGALRHLNRARYFVGHRSFEELRVTERARRANVRTPMVLAAAEQRARPGYTATLATAWIPDAVELAERLADSLPANRTDVLAEAGRQIGIMHRAGIAHPDLNLRNLLIAGEEDLTLPFPAVYVLDFDRARAYDRGIPEARRAADLQRLARSARKLAAPIDEAGWSAFHSGYGADWPLRSPLG